MVQAFFCSLLLLPNDWLRLFSWCAMSHSINCSLPEGEAAASERKREREGTRAEGGGVRRARGNILKNAWKLCNLYTAERAGVACEILYIQAANYPAPWLQDNTFIIESKRVSQPGNTPLFFYIDTATAQHQ